MAVVKEIRSDNCVVRIHDDCFEDEESKQRRLEAVAGIITQAYKRKYLEAQAVPLPDTEYHSGEKKKS